MGEMSEDGQKVQVRARDVMYNMVTIVNNTLLYI